MDGSLLGRSVERFIGQAFVARLAANFLMGVTFSPLCVAILADTSSCTASVFTEGDTCMAFRATKRDLIRR